MNALLRLPKVMNVTGLARSTLYLRIRQGLMTPPIKLGGRCAAWPEHEVFRINAAFIAGKPENEVRQVVAMLKQQRTEDTDTAR